jgi:hypothetical protein
MKFTIKANQIYTSCQEKLNLIYQVAEINPRFISNLARLVVILPFKGMNFEVSEDEEVSKLENVKYLKVILPLSGDSAGIYLKNPNIEASFIEDCYINYGKITALTLESDWDWKFWPLSDMPSINLREMIDYEFIELQY